MDWETLFPGRFLKAAEFQGRDVTLTITSVAKDKLPTDDGGEKTRGIVSFRETERQLALNRTNAVCIVAMFGRETDCWVGKRVTLYPAKARFGAEVVDAIRVKGSPDIEAEVMAVVKLPRKKPQQVTLAKTR